MKTNDVIKEVGRMLQLTNVVEADFSDYSNLDSQTKKDINLLLSSTNEVLSDIATDYLPLKMTEIITVTNGEFTFSTLSKSFYKLIDIKTTNPYKIELEVLKTVDGTYEMTYYYLPDVLALGADIECFGSNLTLYAIAYGVAREYCLISGNYSESEMWNSRFENAMNIARRNPKVTKLKERRWI